MRIRPPPGTRSTVLEILYEIVSDRGVLHGERITKTAGGEHCERRALRRGRKAFGKPAARSAENENHGERVADTPHVPNCSPRACFGPRSCRCAMMNVKASIRGIAH